MDGLDQEIKALLISDRHKHKDFFYQGLQEMLFVKYP